MYKGERCCWLGELQLRLGSKSRRRGGSERPSPGTPVNGTFVLPDWFPNGSLFQELPHSPCSNQRRLSWPDPATTSPRASRGAVLGRQLPFPPPTQLPTAGLSVPAGSSGATWEDFSQVCYNNMIFGVAGQGEFFLFSDGIPGGTVPAPLTALTLRSRRTPSLPFTSLQCISPAPA